MSQAPYSFDLAGVGSMVVDRIVRVARLPRADEKVHVHLQSDGSSARKRVGGVALNHLGWARILGLRVAVFGKQADDAGGRWLRQAMDRLGIARYLDLSGSSSSSAQIYVDSAGDRVIYMERGATAELTPEDVEARVDHLIASSRVVSTEISQLPLRTVRRVLERARAAGARTVLDLDVPLSEAVPLLGSESELWQVLELAEILKASTGALSELTGETLPDARAAALLARLGATALVVTLGKEGAIVAEPGRTVHVEAPGIEARDTTGAGDAFLGGLIAGLHAGLDARDAARLGNACGAACCERFGAFPEEPEACRARALDLHRSLGGGALALGPLQLSARVELGAATQHFLNVAIRELEGAASDLSPTALQAAAELILAAEAHGGRLHLTGIGKPGYVAGYCAALLSSTGTPATVLDASEATHGSVGQLCAGDVLIAVSNSGETAELLATVGAAIPMGIRMIAVTADPDSSLARMSDVVLLAAVRDEGGPLGLAPRASILVELLVLDALSVELQVSKKLDRAAYSRRHPAGALGRRSAAEE